jgi:HSP20 family molecular chaperone IbpA
MDMLFRKRKRCENCDNQIEPGWQFCPSCGQSLRGARRIERLDIGFPFGSLFEQIERQFRDFDKMFSEPFKIAKPRGGGISITISSGQRPRIDIRTSGTFKRLEPEIKRKLGVRQGIAEIPERKEEKPPRITEEPEMRTERAGDRILHIIKLPGAEPAGISIRKLPNSIEIRARAGDKLYFKLFAVPPGLEVVERKFTDGKLTLALAKR